VGLAELELHLAGLGNVADGEGDAGRSTDQVVADLVGVLAQIVVADAVAEHILAGLGNSV